jgi:hypothetical protein
MKWLVGSTLVIATLVGSILFLNRPQDTEALRASDFVAGNIMSDNVMTNKDSMSVSQIQSFLNSKVPTCDTQGLQTSEFGGRDINGDGRVQRWEWAKDRGYDPPFTCLKDFSEGGKSSAQIIYDVSQQFSINPQVLIVLLQKEQALVTDTWPIPGSSQYRTATGYGCPDNEPCDSEYFGLSNQLEWSGRMFRAILNDSPTWFTPYELGTNFIQYNPSSSCGGSNVNIVNRTTQALYNYTPYQPNNAVLNWKFNGGSYPSSCGAYGNLNFFVYFSEWFGTTQGYNVEATVFDSSSDKTGSFIRVGFSLDPKPKSSVTLTYEVSSQSNAQMFETRQVTITPETWNKPDENILVVRGKNNSNLTGTYNYNISAVKNPISSDKGYANTPRSLLPTVDLLQQEVVNNRNVYRLYSEVEQKHAFTADMIERDQLINDGWRDEGTPFMYCESGDRLIARAFNPETGEYRLLRVGTNEYTNAALNGFTETNLDFTASTLGDRPVYWRYDSVNNRSLYTTSLTEGISSGYEDRGVVFNACSSDSQAVFRMYRPSNNSHFLTTSRPERNVNIANQRYRFEGVAFYTCNSSATPVYRLYRDSNNAHFYTASQNEAQSVSQTNYKNEGIKFYLCETANTDVYRLYRESNNSHFYTVSESEREKLINAGSFRDEGVKLKAK